MQSLLPGFMGFGPLYPQPHHESTVSRVGAGGSPFPQIPPLLLLKDSGPCLLLLREKLEGEKCGRTVPTQLTSHPRTDPEMCTGPLRSDLALGASPGGRGCGVPSRALMAGAGQTTRRHLVAKAGRAGGRSGAARILRGSQIHRASARQLQLPRPHARTSSQRSATGAWEAAAHRCLGAGAAMGWRTRGGVARGRGQPGTRKCPGPREGGATWEHLLLEVSETGSPPGAEAAA